MEKITIKIEDELLKKMNDRMIKTGCKSISQCARELIDLGLKIEEAATSQESEGVDDSIDPLLLEILKNNLIWSLETRFLVRFLVEKKADAEPGQMNDFVKKAKEKAITHVNEFIQINKKSSSSSH